MARYLKKGSRGQDVRQVQLALNYVGPSSASQLTADGIFGSQTDARVRQFQRWKNLIADGIVGPNTRSQLGTVPRSESAPPPPPAAGGHVPHADITAMRYPSDREIARWENTIVSYGRWHNPPEPAAGMGGIFPLEDDFGRVAYPYLNWLTAYGVAIEEYMSGGNFATASQEWTDYKRRQGMHPESPGWGGVDKARNVWYELLPAGIRDAIVDNYQGLFGRPREISGRVMDRIRSHKRREMARLNAPRNYPSWFLWVPTR